MENAIILKAYYSCDLRSHALLGLLVHRTVIELRNYQVRRATRRLLTKGRKFPTRIAVEAGDSE